MKGILVLLALAAAGLTWWPVEERAAFEASQVQSLFEGDGDRPVAALTLTSPGRPELIYLRHRGRWRCATAFGAPVHAPLVSEIVRIVLGARGLVRSGDGEEIGADRTAIVVGLHGPDFTKDSERDVTARIEFEAMGERSLARGATGPWLELPTDLAARLVWEADSVLPPLVDDHLVACLWPDGFPGVERIFIDHVGGTSIEVYPVGDASVWKVRQGAQERDVLPYRLAGYLNYLVRVRYRGLGDPRRLVALGLEPGTAKVTLATGAGEPVGLTLGSPTDEGLYVLNRAAELVGQVGEGDISLLAPDLGMLSDGERENPWERWLRH